MLAPVASKSHMAVAYQACFPTAASNQSQPFSCVLLLFCRCLCLPKVLYLTITQAARAGLDVLGLLQSCKTNSSSFKTQWATGEGTLCPNISIDARLGDLLSEFGDAVVIPSSKSRAEWAWANMLQFGEFMGEIPEQSSIIARISGTKALQIMFVVMVCMPMLFLALHHGVLMRLSAAYRGLSAADRMISCQHAVYAVVFSLSLVPQTVIACMSLFYAWTGTFLAANYITLLVALFINTRAILYVGEAFIRSVIKWSWLLVVHHTLFTLVVCLALWTHDTAVVGIGIVLDLFACHEAPLYLALLAYRLQWPPRLARGILRGACVWYVITRIVQTVILVYMIVRIAGMPAINRLYEFVIVAVLCGAFTVIQVYTLVIYRAMDVKLSRRITAAATHSCLPLKPVLAPAKAGVKSQDSLGDAAINIFAPAAGASCVSGKDTDTA